MGGMPIPTHGTSWLPRKNWSRALRNGVAPVLLWIFTCCNAFADPVKITFAPPPMEGTLSLGVYDTAGKLVRVLHREAAPTELKAGDDGLETQWDGKDDQGKPCPPGTYRAHGVLVGDLGVEGVDFIGNDWVTEDDSPRVRRITGLGMSANGTPFLETRPDPFVPLYYSIILKPAATPGEEPDAQLVPEPAMPAIRIYKARVPKLPGNVTQGTFGFNFTVWGIEENAVKQYSDKDKLVRTLPMQPGDPPPAKIAASTADEKLYVLYESATLQRLRGYDFTGVKPGAEPKVLFENDIHACDTYEQIASELQFPDEKPFVPSPSLKVALVLNPLAHHKPGTLEIKVGVDKEGCYLATTDGLPLSHISDTRFLRWAVMGQPAGSKAITAFDSDGAVVEQFQIANIAHMMAFDAGLLQWPAQGMAAPGSIPGPSATPVLSPSPALK